MRRVIGQVVGGKFTDGKPDSNNREHKLHREYVRNDARERYGRDIQQQYKNGQVNPEYIEAFGKNNAINRGLVEEPKYE